MFSAQGSSFETEVWGDLGVMASVFNREGGYQSLTVRLVDPVGHSRLGRPRSWAIRGCNWS